MPRTLDERATLTALPRSACRPQVGRAVGPAASAALSASQASAARRVGPFATTGWAWPGVHQDRHDPSDLGGVVVQLAGGHPDGGQLPPGVTVDVRGRGSSVVASPARPRWASARARSTSPSGRRRGGRRPGGRSGGRRGRGRSPGCTRVTAGPHLGGQRGPRSRSRSSVGRALPTSSHAVGRERGGDWAATSGGTGPAGSGPRPPRDRGSAREASHVGHDRAGR